MSGITSGLGPKKCLVPLVSKWYCSIQVAHHATEWGYVPKHMASPKPAQHVLPHVTTQGGGHQGLGLERGECVYEWADRWAGGTFQCLEPEMIMDEPMCLSSVRIRRHLQDLLGQCPILKKRAEQWNDLPRVTTHQELAVSLHFPAQQCKILSKWVTSGEDFQ